MDRVVIRVMIGVSIKASEYGHFYTHFDDPTANGDANANCRQESN